MKIKMLTLEDKSAVLELQDKLFNSLARADLSVRIADSDLHSLLAGDGEAVGTVIDNQLLAVCALLKSGNINLTNNMGVQLGFNEQQLESVEQLEMALVHPALRGQKMQQKLAAILVVNSATRAIKQKKPHFLLTTVSPYNYPSVQTVLSLGLIIVKIANMYKGWTRYVACRYMPADIEVVEQTHHSTAEKLLDLDKKISVDVNDIQKQKELINQKYYGFAQIKHNNGVEKVVIEYAPARKGIVIAC